MEIEEGLLALKLLKIKPHKSVHKSSCLGTHSFYWHILNKEDPNCKTCPSRKEQLIPLAMNVLDCQIFQAIKNIRKKIED